MKIIPVELECKRCGHKWVPRGAEVRQCPKCRSPWWDVEKPAGVEHAEAIAGKEA